MIVLSFTTFLRGCHYDYLPQVPQNLAIPLLSDLLKFIPTVIVPFSAIKLVEFKMKRMK